MKQSILNKESLIILSILALITLTLIIGGFGILNIHNIILESLILILIFSPILVIFYYVLKIMI